MNHLRLLLFASFLASCSSPPRKDQASEVAPQVENDWQKINETGIAEFRQKYASSEVAPGFVPSFEWKEIKRLSKRMTLLTGDVVKLTLNLGNRFTVKGSGRFRTTSRYQLTDSAGRRMAEAESLIHTGDIGSKGLPDSLAVLYDTGSRSFFVAEDYAWSNLRLILMEATGRVKYLKLPERTAIPPHLRNSRIQGFKDGLVYFETEGRTYAIPAAQLQEEESLEYGIG